MRTIYSMEHDCIHGEISGNDQDTPLVDCWHNVHVLLHVCDDEIWTLAGENSVSALPISARTCAPI